MHAMAKNQTYCRLISEVCCALFVRFRMVKIKDVNINLHMRLQSLRVTLLVSTLS